MTFNLRKYLSLTIWLVLGILAAQRFSFPHASGFFCVIPLIVYFSHTNLSSSTSRSLLFVSLAWSTDIAVMGFGDTFFLIRYFIYVLILLTLIYQSKINLNVLLIVLIFLILVISRTILFNGPISFEQLFRDAFIILIVILAFALKTEDQDFLKIDFLFLPILGYLLSEFLNFFIFKSVWDGEYLSYNSVKYLVVFPSIYATFKWKTVPALILIAITMIVLIGYTSRMLFLIFIVTSLISILFFDVREKFTKLSIILGLCLFILLIQSFSGSLLNHLVGSKSLVMTQLLLTDGFKAIERLDPVRYASSAMFFGLDLSEILFGRGLGAGIFDSNGLLSFVQHNQTAFTSKEINSHVFFNFHDVWVDIGLRFGFVPMIFIGIFLFRKIGSNCRDSNILLMMIIIGIFTSFFSTAGLISICVLIRTYLGLRCT